MIKFLLLGLIRDRHRSLFPIIVVTLGVMITCFLYSYMNGFVSDFIRSNAIFDTGHVKVMTRAYADIANQIPNDLALFDADQICASLHQDYPQYDWVERIKFGGLLDFPDEEGVTRVQGPVFGLGIDLLDSASTEVERLNLNQSLVRGRLPEEPGEMVISDDFAQALDVEIGDLATLIGATANGGMAVFNFRLVGTVSFGISALDRSAMLADITDIQYALDMEDGAGEILGFLPEGFYDDDVCTETKDAFNANYIQNDDEFSPVMITLLDQNNLGDLLFHIDVRKYIMVIIFISVMSIVLWNTGLTSGIRRYTEMGIRLAIGESKGHVYGTLISEAVIVGLVGSTLGTMLGLTFAYYLQEVGYDISSFAKGTSILISSVLRAHITPGSFYIGFIPGLGATILGAAFSGIGLFKRQTSQLFRELEE
ncbi:hypothetical protein CEE37_05675 [candidate division LCP-89 bacterium B3_LCP]|uniref:ABC3 transporter permease C-terminal domain-containing protein n=1 Tax=candidate division LCP-89 bacterium B3_LCP TaxID=2012998 RepID=A0A532V2D8_UNCL8|nr:MAG: hypothetical protein CEE37_05675 [candidate division LCP-89 bacterium B3_LCP]